VLSVVCSRVRRSAWKCQKKSEYRVSSLVPWCNALSIAKVLGTRDRPATLKLACSLGLGLHSTSAVTPTLLRTCFTYKSSRRITMAAVYRPTEAIALLRPSFLLPRMRPVSARRAQPGRMAFSTSPCAQATHSSTSSPTPQPQRKSITLTGDTGQVRWSDLSPGEKAVRTTQQSFNLVVVVVGILATV
jgi:hypothetical protein